ncbi:MAG: hypothetical protein ABI818_17120 [Acidobacteriota bacterium]
MVYAIDGSRVVDDYIARIIRGFRRARVPDAPARLPDSPVREPADPRPVAHLVGVGRRPVPSGRCGISAPAAPAHRIVGADGTGRRAAGSRGGRRTQPRVPDAWQDSQIRELRDTAALRHRGGARQSLYSGSTGGGKKGAHAAVGIGLSALFGINTVTGVWNMFGKEGRMDTEGRSLRLVHGLLMLAADVGFAATLAAAPNSDHGANFASDLATHRNLAIASISIGTAGYLAMIFGNR